MTRSVSIVGYLSGCALSIVCVVVVVVFLFQAEDGIRYLVRSRGLGDVYKSQALFRQSISPCRIGFFS